MTVRGLHRAVSWAVCMSLRLTLRATAGRAFTATVARRGTGCCAPQWLYIPPRVTLAAIGALAVVWAVSAPLVANAAAVAVVGLALLAWRSHQVVAGAHTAPLLPQLSLRHLFCHGLLRGRGSWSRLSATAEELSVNDAGDVALVTVRASGAREEVTVPAAAIHDVVINETFYRCGIKAYLAVMRRDRSIAVVFPVGCFENAGMSSPTTP